MKRWIQALLLSTMVMGITACVSTHDIEVENISNNKVNMKGYKTYQFLEDSGIVEDDGSGKLKASDKKIAAMIEEVINTELQKKGKRPVSKDPDFFVAYVGGSNLESVRVKLDKKGKQTIKNTPKAALLIMLVDADTGSILRLSTAEGKMKNLPAEQQRERIEYAVKKMLRDI